MQGCEERVRGDQWNAEVRREEGRAGQKDEVKTGHCKDSGESPRAAKGCLCHATVAPSRRAGV
jgi:hypothetical protein